MIIIKIIMVDLKLEFGGGMELLFGNIRSHNISLPDHVPNTQPPRPANISFLLQWMKENLLKDPRVELFLDQDGQSVQVPLSIKQSPLSF